MIEQPKKNIQWVHLAPATDDDHDRVRATTTVCNGSNGLTLVTLSLWLLVFPCVAMAGGGGLVQTAVVDASTVFVVVFYFVVSYFVVSNLFSNHAFEFGPRQRRPLKSSAELIKCSRGEPDKQFPLASNGVITVYIHGQKITQSFGVFRRETCETICIAALTDNLVLWKRQT